LRQFARRPVAAAADGLRLRLIPYKFG